MASVVPLEVHNRVMAAGSHHGLGNPWPEGHPRFVVQREAGETRVSFPPLPIPEGPPEGTPGLYSRPSA